MSAEGGYIIEESRYPWTPPCPHDEWEPCWKHHDSHDECRRCGALRYPTAPSVVAAGLSGDGESGDSDHG